MSRALAEHLTAYLTRVEPKSPAQLGEAVSRLLGALDEGYVCLDGSLDESLLELFLPLRDLSRVVGSPGAFRPLILDGDRLYLTRYWLYEQKVADALLTLSRPLNPFPDRQVLERHVEALGLGDRDQVAALTGAATRHLAVIHGGPGTGKTTTVAAILALRLMTKSPGQSLTIRLAAPTGKAADRLRESIAKAKAEALKKIPDEVKRAIPEEASTIHRLLGIGAEGRPPKYHRDNPLPADLVVLDEASMIDLSLLEKVLDAIPPKGSLILLGDKNQLDAVQPGHVFGDISSAVGGRLGASIFALTRSHRFDSGRGIGKLAAAVNAGDEHEAIGVLANDDSGELIWMQSDAPAEDAALREPVMDWLRPFFGKVGARATEKECFDAFSRYRLLTPLRNGPGDVGSMNAKIEEWLKQGRMLEAGREWYAGRPVMITSNNRTLGLYNGDIGLTLEDAAGNLAVVFPGANGTWRRISPGRLPDFDVAYAATVHKSQGSEFENVLLLIPVGDNPVIGRNLLYTGITRAKKTCQVWGSEEALRTATRRRSVRGSGLYDRLR